MEICDIINSSEEAAKDAARAIKKRLHHFSGKNYTAVMYTLTVSLLGWMLDGVIDEISHNRVAGVICLGVSYYATVT